MITFKDVLVEDTLKSVESNNDRNKAQVIIMIVSENLWSTKLRVTIPRYHPPFNEPEWRFEKSK